MKELTLLFLIKDTQVLLAMKKRGFGVGKWNGVGGKLEAGETIEQALVRECSEEIEVTVTAFEKMADIIFHEYDEGQIKDLHVHIFTSSKWKGEPRETEEMAPRWFDISQLPLKEMWPDDEFWLPQVLEGKKIRAEFSLDANNVITDKSIVETDVL